MTNMAQLPAIDIRLDDDSIQVMGDLVETMTRNPNEVDALIHACHALRISHECYVRTTLDGKVLREYEYVQVPADFFREMLDALKGSSQRTNDG